MLAGLFDSPLHQVLKGKSIGDYYEMGWNCAVYGAYPYYYRDQFPNVKMKMAWESGKKDGETFKKKNVSTNG